MRSTRPLLTMYQPMKPCSPPSANIPTSLGSSARGIRPAASSTRNGTRNAKPTRRPRKRCVHSHQKMRLKAPRLMPLLTCWYCGICRYLSKASCQSASDSGGTMPMIGFHSVIDRPEPVRRVAPPTLTSRKTSAATVSSQTRTGVVSTTAVVALPGSGLRLSHRRALTAFCRRFGMRRIAVARLDPAQGVADVWLVPFASGWKTRTARRSAPL